MGELKRLVISVRNASLAALVIICAGALRFAGGPAVAQEEGF